MLSAEDNELLTRVGPGTPMGSYIREFWLPYLPSNALAPGGAPKAMFLLGEQLLAFRSPSGEVGVIEELCPHRRASLALGWNEPEGLRCLYHGWQVNCSGAVVDTPTEPDSSLLRTRVRSIGYRTHEAGGLVWVYMGRDQEQPPEFPTFEWTTLPDESHVTVIMQEACNWVQALEGVIDSAHSNYLHRGSIRPEIELSKRDGASEYTDQGSLTRPSADGRPTIELEDTPVGFRYGAIRRSLENAGPYVRTTHFLAPVFSSFPAPPGWGHVQIFTPIDDYRTMFFYVRYRADGSTISPELRANFLEQSGLRPGVDVDESWRRIRNSGNWWLQDRALMTDYQHSGLFGVQTEDAAVQESMGTIVDRSKEHLGRTDRAIMHMRRIMIDAALAHEQTGEVRYREPAERYQSIRGEERIIAEGEDWAVVGALS